MGFDIAVDGNFQSYQNTDNFKKWRAIKNLEDAMLTLNYQSWQRSLSELPKSCQQWELIFLSTVAFRATKILSMVEVDILVNRSFQSYQNSDNFKS